MENTEGTGPKTGWYRGWTIVVVCVGSVMAANALPINAFPLFLEGWTVALHVKVSTLQIGLAFVGVGCAPLALIGGMIVDKYPGRLILAAGLVIVALFCLGISLMTHVWQYIALYALLAPVGLTFATTVPANAVVTRWFVRHRGLALGLTAMGIPLAGVVMPPIIAALLPLLGWRMIWRIGAALVAFVILPSVLFVVRERPSERDGLHYLSGAAGASVHGHGGAASGDKMRWGQILARRNFWLLVAAYLPLLALSGGTGYNLAPIALSRGMSEQTAGFFLSAWSLSQLLAMPAGGLISDRFGNRLPLAGLALLCAAGGVIIAFAHTVPLLMLGALLAGLGASYWPLVASSLAMEFGTAGFGRAFGTLVFFLPLGSAGPLYVAKWQESTGSYVIPLLVLVGFALLSATASLCLRERRGGHMTPAEHELVEEAAVTLPSV